MTVKATPSPSSVVLRVVCRPPMPVAALLVGNLFVSRVLAARVVRASKESAPILLADVFNPGSTALLATVRGNKAFSRALEFTGRGAHAESL